MPEKKAHYISTFIRTQVDTKHVDILFWVKIKADTAKPPVSTYGRWLLTRAQTIMGQNVASSAYGFIHVKSQFREKNPVLPIERFLSLVLPMNAISYKTLLSNFHSIICQVVAYRKLNTKENFKLLALKVVAVAYDRWSLTRGSKYSDLTGILLVFWKSSC